MQTRATTIGLVNGTPRLWLEGQWLMAAGFEPGQPYQVSYQADRIEIRRVTSLTPTDPTLKTRKVSRKVRGGETVPVLDLLNSKIAFTGPAFVGSVMPGYLVIVTGE